MSAPAMRIFLPHLMKGLEARHDLTHIHDSSSIKLASTPPSSRRPSRLSPCTLIRFSSLIKVRPHIPEPIAGHIAVLANCTESCIEIQGVVMGYSYLRQLFPSVESKRTVGVEHDHYDRRRVLDITSLPLSPLTHTFSPEATYF